MSNRGKVIIRIVVPFHRTAVHSPGWLHWADQAETRTGWCCWGFCWPGGWWTLLMVLRTKQGEVKLEAVEKTVTGYWNWNYYWHYNCWTLSWSLKVKLCHVKHWVSLTSLVGGDVDRRVLWWIRTLVRHSIDSLYFKGVLGVSQEVTDVDWGVRQSQLTRDKLHVVSTAGAAPPPTATALTYDVVDNIFSSTTLVRWAPLQPQRGLIHYGDDVLWSWWNSWKRKGEKKIILILYLSKVLL